MFTTWYQPQTIPQPVFKPSQFSQVGSAYQAATAYGGAGLPFPGAAGSWAGGAGGGMPPAVAPIGQPMLLELGAAVDTEAAAHVHVRLEDTALQGLPAERLARILALHSSLVSADTSSPAGQRERSAAVLAELASTPLSDAIEAAE